MSHPPQVVILGRSPTPAGRQIRQIYRPGHHPHPQDAYSRAADTSRSAPATPGRPRGSNRGRPPLVEYGETARCDSECGQPRALRVTNESPLGMRPALWQAGGDTDEEEVGGWVSEAVVTHHW